MSDWVYSPISIHLSDSNHTYATSGVYLFNILTAEYLILSVTGLSNLSSFSFRFTANELINHEYISWVPLELQDVRYFKAQNHQDSFSEFVKGLVLCDGFTFKPTGIENLCLLTFKIPSLSDPNVYPLFAPRYLLPLNPIDGSAVKIPSNVAIDCCPFSLTNVSIFINYKHHGTLNYKFRNGLGYFSDCRYFDDIVGGLVKLDNGEDQSIGLVAGSLAKTNGDGSLLTVVSWSSIFELLNYPQINLNSHRDTASKTKHNYLEDIPESVVRISIQTINDENFWGSGVILSNDFIVTNEHVMRYNELRSLTITTANGKTFSLFDVDLIPSPIIGYDLYFLKIRPSSFDIKPADLCNTYKSQIESLRIGAQVTSVGNGLFFSRYTNQLTPLHSVGKITDLISIEIDNGFQELAMILTSAGCWNGSSGGGLFNKKGELIGIMTSNGKLSNGEIVPNFTLVIPITIIEKCLFMIKNGIDSVDASEKIKDLWMLKSNHLNFYMANVPAQTNNGAPKTPYKL